MAHFTYTCIPCETDFDQQVFMSDYDKGTEFPCPRCHSRQTIRKYTPVPAIYIGEGFTSAAKVVRTR